MRPLKFFVLLMVATFAVLLIGLRLAGSLVPAPLLTAIGLTISWGAFQALVGVALLAFRVSAFTRALVAGLLTALPLTGLYLETPAGPPGVVAGHVIGVVMVGLTQAALHALYRPHGPLGLNGLDGFIDGVARPVGFFLLSLAATLVVVGAGLSHIGSPHQDFLFPTLGFTLVFGLPASLLGALAIAVGVPTTSRLIVVAFAAAVGILVLPGLPPEPVLLVALAQGGSHGLPWIDRVPHRARPVPGLDAHLERVERQHLERLGRDRARRDG